MNLSIIIPHHNQPDLLEIALRSIGNDPLTQIIVIDDHSDQHLDELEALKKNPMYAHVLFLECPQGQKGPGCARNIGIEKALGKYLMVVDADDYLEAGYQNILQPYLDSDLDLVCFTPISRIIGTQEDAHRVDKYIKLIADYLNDPCEKTEDAIRFTFYITPSKLYKRSLIETYHIRYDETMVSEDVMFSMRVGAYAKTIACSKEVIYCATRSANSLTMTQNKQTYDTRFNILLIQHVFIREKIGEKRYKKLDLPSLIFIVNAFTYHLGLGVAIKSASMMRKNHIRILRSNQFKINRITSFLRLSKGAKQASQK
ncbi:MAG: glycosyltransferase family 2 protein [Erysipelotrichaceae bacterium]|nr:glycosyltransferase family 2 protein [Erysipelotrichaceae bacterium]